MGKMAADKMKNMPPGSMEQMKKAMAESMDPAALKQSIEMLKTNPGMVKQLAAQTSMTEEQLKQTVDMFGNMTDDQVDKALRYMGRLQKLKGTATTVWNKLNKLCAGQLTRIILFITVYIVSTIVKRFLGGTAAVGDVDEAVLAKDDPV